MTLTAAVTVSGIMEAGKCYQGQILKFSPNSPAFFVFYNFDKQDWFQEPLHRFVPIGGYLFEGNPRSGAV